MICCAALSTGAIAGIAVGATVAVMVGVGVIGWLFGHAGASSVQRGYPSKFDQI